MRGNAVESSAFGAVYREGVKRATEPYLREIMGRKNRRAPEGLDTKGEMWYTYRKEIIMANSVEFKCKCGNSGWVTENEETNPCPYCGRVYIGEYNSARCTIDALEVDNGLE